MDRKTKVILGGALTVAILAGGTGIAVASGRDDTERPITGSALDKAGAAALAHAGGGRVTETEIGDEDGYYEVEITLHDGSQVDVHLDRAFNVLDRTPDHDSPGNDDQD